MRSASATPPKGGGGGKPSGNLPSKVRKKKTYIPAGAYETAIAEGERGGGGKKRSC